MLIGDAPLSVISSSDPYEAGSSPEIVPVAMRSPARIGVPLEVRCAICCGAVQYSVAALVVESRSGRSSARLSHASNPMSSPHGWSTRRWGAGSGSCGGDGTLAASIAAIGRTHADTDVANDLPRNGPSGRYSNDWMSRALQSLTATTPNRCSRAEAVRTSVPGSLGLPRERSAHRLRWRSSRSAAGCRCPRPRRFPICRDSRPGCGASSRGAARCRDGRSDRGSRRAGVNCRNRRSHRPATAGAAEPRVARRAAERPSARRPGRSGARRCVHAPRPSGWV